MGIAVEFRNLTKTYRKRKVLDGLNLSIRDGDFTVIYGMPASGKSVLLRLLMGLEKPTEGEIWLRGSDCSGVSPGARNIGYVPQSFALFPHLSVFDNIAYPLKMNGMQAAEAGKIVAEAARLLKIDNLLEKRPDQISGGQKQRVAIARGIVKQSDIYVLDDPLAGLDFKLREQLVDDLKQLHKQFGMTFIYMTSDANEALSLAKNVALLEGGRIVECGPPARLYDSPERLATMRLLGFPPANVMPAALYDKEGMPWVKTGLFEFPLERDKDAGGGTNLPDEVVVGFRPESVDITGNAREGAACFPCRDALREDLGGEEIVYLESGSSLIATVVRHRGYERINEVQSACIEWSNLFVFERSEGRRIGRGAAVGVQHSNR